MVMGRFKRFISELFGGLALILLVHAQDQSDFISIDCGLPENSSYTERRTGVDYISDAGFIDSGINGQISTEFKGDLQQQVWSLRSFPEGIRNCYSIRITQGTKYLIRATFFYGNYDGESKLPEFDVHLGANMWNTIKITNVSDGFVKELIHVPPLNYIQLCLVNTQRGTPFISAIELRPLPNSTYVTTDGSLERFWRVDVGSESNLQYRYKDDVCDRIWWPYNYEEWTGLSTSLPIEEWTGLSTTLTIESPSSNPYRPPSVVMSTATTPINDSASLNFHWYAEDATSKYYIYMHFAEVVKLKANKSRSFNVMLNGKHMNGPIMPDYLSAFTLYSEGALTPTGEKYVFSLIKTENSTLPPIINAIEVYSVKNLLQSETDQEDVGAITKIKSTYGVKRNWQGDPCAPQAYLWEGLNCSYDGYNAPRVISLNLSSSELTGAISADISTLVMLQYLDLSNNSLTGSVPDFLSQLQYLEVLNLERNQFNGSIPAELIKRSKSGSLLLSVGENSNLCASDSCERKKLKNNIVVLILASVVGLLILSLTIAAIFCGLTRRKKQDKTRVALVDTEPNVQNRPLESMQRQVTYSDLQRITNNFERILGKGGFGTVYYGCMDGIRVAVKVKLLVRVHHKNLTTLVGYCYEGTNMGLVYEYYKSNWLNEKSDVYSFGVVLLKIITNRPVIGRSQDRTHISQWVSFMLAKGDIQNIVDPRLGGDFDVNSVWKAVEVAVVCVSPTSSRRPTMSQVVAELKESLTTELSQKMEGYGVELKDSFDMINMDLDTELNPLARHKKL
ncbi:putative leucine-rich repeat receptor-like protein kinase [Quercus suber]|uniref:Leucine-rich repeat receptor-like protein kinase n=1 Tax=Quercus suber TaxID=58331 RepID=A0AAW0LCY0_QUESU